MYIIRSGILNKVLTKEQYEMIDKNMILANDIKLEDTVRTFVKEDGQETEYLPFKISYKDVDQKGRDKFVFNEENKEFEQNYFSSSVIYAYGKEMRILLELDQYAPVKVVYKEHWNGDRLYRTAICVQDQKLGKIE